MTPKIDTRRPINYRDLEVLVVDQPVFIYNKAAIGAEYLEFVVRRTNSIIRPLNGTTTLPPELWLDIVDMAWGKGVLPKAIEGRKSSNPTPVCRESTVKLRRGEIKRKLEACILQEYLDTHIPGSFGILFPDQSSPETRIESRLLRSNPGVLWDAVEIADVIAWVEDGVCSLCDNGDHWITVGSGSAKMERFAIPIDGNVIDIGRVVCPLCVGWDYALATLRYLGSSVHIGESEIIGPMAPKSDETLKAWRSERLEQLGYPRVLFPTKKIDQQR